jgi:hypothetical protein
MKRKRGSKGPQSMNNLNKLIPGLIFQMEQFDVQLIKLTSVVSSEKDFVSKLVKRSQVRDFRLKVNRGAM